jgi:hypothetical protein
MADSRVLVSTPATLEAVFYDGGETPVDPGTVTVTITRADGTAVVTDAATTGSGTSARTYTLPAQTRLDHLTAVWTGTTGGRKVTTRHEVVGAYYADLAEIRGLDALANTSKYSTGRLEQARWQAESRFEAATGVAWVPRHDREIIAGNNTTIVLLRWPRPRSLIGVSIDGTAAADLTLFRLYSTGQVERTSGATWPTGTTTSGNVIVEYTHGYDSPPADLKQAFLTYVRYLVLESTSRIPDRASAFSTEAGTFQLVTAGFNRPTGLPDVDAVLNEYSLKVPGIAVA